MLLPWTRNLYGRVKVYQREFALCLNTCLGELISSDICVPSPSMLSCTISFHFPNRQQCYHLHFTNEEAKDYWAKRTTVPGHTASCPSPKSRPFL